MVESRKWSTPALYLLLLSCILTQTNARCIHLPFPTISMSVSAVGRHDYELSQISHTRKKQHLSVGCAGLPEHEKKGCAWPVWCQLRGCEQPHPGPHHPQPGRHFSAACLLSARCGLRFTSACLWLCLQHGCCLATMWRGRLQVREGKLKRFNQFFLLHGSFLQLESPHLPSQGSTNEAGESCFKRKH